MEYDGSEHRGQQELGCVAITVILSSFSLAWIWSMYIPSGRGSKGLLSIRTSFLCQHRFTRSREVQCIIPASLPPTPSIPRFTKVGQEPSSNHIYTESTKQHSRYLVVSPQPQNMSSSRRDRKT